MTRRESLFQLGTAFMFAAKARAQTFLSRRGDFLNGSNEEERYWFFSACDGLERFRRLAYAHPEACELREIARSATGLPVYAVRVGRGPKQVVILQGMHGPEPSGPRGLLAYLDALLNATAPFGISVARNKILGAITLHLVPLLNPRGRAALRATLPRLLAWHLAPRLERGQ